MPPGKVCPGCGFYNQIRIGSRDELYYFRVILIDRDQKDFFCGIDCYQKYLLINYGKSSIIKPDQAHQLKVKFQQKRSELAIHTEKEGGNSSEFKEGENSLEFKESENYIDVGGDKKQYQYVTKRRSSHANTKTSVVEIDKD
jgi:hypothetical protein